MESYHNNWSSHLLASQVFHNTAYLIKIINQTLIYNDYQSLNFILKTTETVSSLIPGKVIVQHFSNCEKVQWLLCRSPTVDN